MTLEKKASTLKFNKFHIIFNKHGLVDEETREQLIPGAVLKLRDGSTHLVGTVNQLLGVCDDCTEFHIEDIAKIAYLW